MCVPFVATSGPLIKRQEKNKFPEDIVWKKRERKSYSMVAARKSKLENPLYGSLVAKVTK